MRKIYLLLLCSFAITVRAQIPNNSFELVDTSTGSPTNWSEIVLIPIPCTVSEGFDSLYFRTDDAWEGSYALELRNAHCDATMAAGGVNLHANNFAYAFADGSPYDMRPDQFSFYYKFFPTGGDKVHIIVSLQNDTTGELIGDADQYITGTAASYSPVDIPISYYSSATPNHIFFSVVMTNDTASVHFGSRFLMDAVHESVLSVAAMGVGKALNVFPNPATGVLNMKLPGSFEGNYFLMDMQGRCLQQGPLPANGALNVQSLPHGSYLLRVRDTEGLEYASLVQLQ